MKRILVLYLLFFLVHGISFGQYESRKGYAGISMGTGLAVGDFGSKNILQETSGFANDGFVLNLNFAYRIASNFGLTGMVLIQANSFDDKAFLEEIKKNSFSAGVHVNYISVEADSWSLSGFMAGGFASLPLEREGIIILEPRAMLCLLTAISPGIKISARDGFSTVYVDQQNGAGIGLGYSLGGGVRFNMSDKTALLLNADYVQTMPKFYDVEYRYSNGSIEYYSFEQKIQTVNIVIGLAIRIKKDTPPVRKKYN